MIRKFSPALRIAISCALLAAGHAAAQVPGGMPSYPFKPVRLIVPYPPGGATDIVARALAQKFSDSMKQQVVVDNRGGGGQLIGTDLAAKATPDGHTIILVTITHSINPSLHRQLPYDSIRDFSAISLVASSPQILVAHPSLGAGSVRELLSLAHTKPAAINYASSGNGSGGHLAMELFRGMTALRLVHVPYKGAGPALADMLGGQVQLMFTSPLAALPHVKNGRLRALAMASRSRSKAAPDLPTVAESGVPGFEASLWYGLLAPAGTSQPIITRLHTETVKTLRLPDVAERLSSQGVEPHGSTPQELLAFLKAETVKWAAVIRQAGIRLD